MYEIFEKLCNARGITTYKFCKETGINSSTISTWKKNNSIARPELAKKVCEYFGISMDYLMTGKENDENDSYYLNDETRKIAKEIYDNPNLMRFVSYYSYLSEINKMRIGKNIEALYELEEAEKPIAAHMNKDATQEEIEHDNDIMNDDDFWNN